MKATAGTEQEMSIRKNQEGPERSSSRSHDLAPESHWAAAEVRLQLHTYTHTERERDY